MKTYLGKLAIVSIVLTLLVGLQTLTLASPVIGRVDRFSDGTTQGWGGSYPGYTPYPLHISSGGPAGPNDPYMEISSSGFHLATRNVSRSWTGDYLAVGVRAISVDVIHLTGNVDIRLRLAVFGPGGMFTTIERAPPLREQSGWVRYTFSLTADDLVHVAGGTGKLEDTLGNVTKVLIRHDSETPSPSGTHPPHVVASIGLDNITAVLRDYDVAWTFSNVDDTAYRLDRIEPAHIPLGELDAENPTLALTIGQRYQVTITSPLTHPWELIAKGANEATDHVVLSMTPGVTGLFENNEAVQWDDPGMGTVAFTLTEALWAALQGNGQDPSPGYRCGVHSATMRGDLVLLEEPPSQSVAEN